MCPWPSQDTSKSCSVVTGSQMYCEVTCDWVLNRMLFQQVYCEVICDWVLNQMLFQQVYCEVICDWVLNRMIFQRMSIHAGSHT
jgi:hypothetical protein